MEAPISNCPESPLPEATVPIYSQNGGFASPVCCAPLDGRAIRPPGSDRPCAAIEINTASAAMFAMRSPSGAAEPSTNSANAIVATPSARTTP